MKKDIYTQAKLTVAKVIFYVFTISTISKSEICFDTGGRGGGGFTMRYDTFVSR